MSCVYQCIYPCTGLWRISVDSSQDYIYVSSFLCLFIHVYFWQPFVRPLMCAAYAAAGHGSKSPEWKYNMLVRMFVHPYGCFHALCYFCICINFHCGGSSLQRIYPHTGVWRTPVGSLSVHPRLFLATICAAFNVCSVCGRRPWIQIPWVEI